MVTCFTHHIIKWNTEVYTMTKPLLTNASYFNHFLPYSLFQDFSDIKFIPELMIRQHYYTAL